jgi:UDP-GlcNAc:undecaprenyl-phosphate GlcNAc-1-phosphate transferase
MKNFLIFSLFPLASLLLSFILIPLFRKAALKVGFVDKPNFRKKHFTPIPLVGGISVFISSAIIIGFISNKNQDFKTLIPVFIGAFVLLIMGIIDDKLNLKALYKLLIQILVSYYIYLSGIKIDSLYGILWVNELPEYASMLITIIVITGTVNAFNLSDGIDGLAGGIAILGFSAFSIISIILNHYVLAILYLTFIGSLIGFLRFNLSKKHKVFMGDAGSLFLGFILVVSGIMLLQFSSSTANITKTFSVVVGVLIIPVFDSIRVYFKRIKKGYSPFRADRTHLHHLLINLKLDHKKATFSIVILVLTLIIISIFSSSYFSKTFTLVIILLIFGIITKLLSLNDEINDWLKKMKEIEKR